MSRDGGRPGPRRGGWDGGWVPSLTLQFYVLVCWCHSIRKVEDHGSNALSMSKRSWQRLLGFMRSGRTDSRAGLGQDLPEPDAVANPTALLIWWCPSLNSRRWIVVVGPRAASPQVIAG